MMSIIEEIENLEEKGLWQTALMQLANELHRNPNREVAIRLLFVCWYALIEWGCLDISEEATNELFESKLKDVTKSLIANYSDDPEVNFYLGYMISLSAWFFSDDVEKWEKKASDMLTFAAQAEPNNPIYQMVHLGNIGNKGKEYLKYCKLAKQQVNEKYSGKGEFNMYFRQVLNR